MRVDGRRLQENRVVSDSLNRIKENVIEDRNSYMPENLYLRGH